MILVGNCQIKCSFQRQTPTFHLYMADHTRNNKYSIKVSIESRKSNLSSCRSLERPSWDSRQHSLTKNHSFIEVMSLESNRKSDIYEKMLEEDRPALQRQSMGGLNSQNYPSYEYVGCEDQFIAPRKSQEPCESTISHTCKCYSDCEWQNCACLDFNKQPCLEGYCCQGCITKKSALLAALKEQIATQQQIFCTCKKTKCQKKYCSCFAAGIMCGEKCSCEGCINCPRKSENGMDIEEEEPQLTEQELAAMEMPERMDFEPFIYGRISN